MRIFPAVTAAAVAAVAALTVAGCSSDDSPSPGPGASASAGSTAAATRITVTVAGGKVSPAPSVHHIHLGDHVVLTVTSDKVDEAHLHGYDKEIELQPGTPGTIDFTADVPGVFEFETHKSGLQLMQLEVK